MTPKTPRGRRPKTEAIPAEGYQIERNLGRLLLGSVKIDPRKRNELLADQNLRAAIASRLEEVLSEADFARAYPNASGGRAAELERIGLWTKWHPDSPAKILARAWDEGGMKRAALLSKWVLARGTEKDKKEAERWGKSARSVRESDLREVTRTGKFPSTDLNGTLPDGAYVFAMVICGFVEQPLQRGQKQSSFKRRLAEALAESLNRTTAKSVSDAEGTVGKTLKKLGFPKTIGTGLQ